MSSEVWVWGASGRTGRLIARRLREAGVAVVLVGRDRGRLETLSEQLGGSPRLVVGCLQANLALLAHDAPRVVVNTVGPFTATGLDIARACPAGTHYVDVANEFTALEQVLALDRQAAAAGQVFVTGSGFGVLATESVVLRLCESRPRPSRVRVDALAAIALQAGVIGTALAATIVEIVSFGGREVRRGRLVRARVAGHYAPITTPDGDDLATGSGASGELLAAWRASDADTVIAASPAAPSNGLVRRTLPAIAWLVRLPGVSRLAIGIIARIRFGDQEMTRASSWGHARVEWADGTVREGWLRVGDGTEFTAAVAAEVTQRLLRGEGRPGAHTPGALFGHQLAEDLGGEFIVIDHDAPPQASGVDRVPPG